MERMCIVIAAKIGKGGTFADGARVGSMKLNRFGFDTQIVPSSECGISYEFCVFLGNSHLSSSCADELSLLSFVCGCAQSLD